MYIFSPVDHNGSPVGYKDSEVKNIGKIFVESGYELSNPPVIIRLSRDPNFRIESRTEIFFLFKKKTNSSIELTVLPNYVLWGYPNTYYSKARKIKIALEPGNTTKYLTLAKIIQRLGTRVQIFTMTKIKDPIYYRAGTYLKMKNFFVEAGFVDRTKERQQLTFFDTTKATPRIEKNKLFLINKKWNITVTISQIDYFINFEVSTMNPVSKVNIAQTIELITKAAKLNFKKA